MRFLGTTFVAMLTLLAAAGGAQAASSFSSVPGGVRFDGDDAPHTIQVIESDRDLQEREWALQPDWRASLRDGVSSFVRLVERSVAFDGLAEFRDESPLYMAASSWGILIYGDPLIPQAVREKVKELANMLDTLESQTKQVVATRYETLNKLKQLAYDLERDVVKPADVARLKAQIYANGEEALASLKALLPTLAERVRTLTGEIQDAIGGAGPREVRELLDRSRKLASQAEAVGERGLARIGAVGGLLWIATGALSVYQTYGEVVNSRSIVVVDSSGAPVEPGFLCRHVVRANGGGQVPNAVSCPVLRAPQLFAGGLALTVNGGAANDRIDVLLGGDQPFDTIDVRGLGGNDTIEGSPAAEQLLGGAGNDTIYGHGGNDRILGDIDVLSTSSPGNDILVGGAGNDFIYGQAGDDLVVGGKNDDRDGSGIALAGGPGNDVIVGGSGSDEMSGGEGKDTVLAKESDFTTSITGSTRQTDVYDPVVDCGTGSSFEYFTASAKQDAEGNPETGFGCGTNLGSAPGSLQQLINWAAQGKRWPWIK